MVIQMYFDLFWFFKKDLELFECRRSDPYMTANFILSLVITAFAVAKLHVQPLASWKITTDPSLTCITWTTRKPVGILLSKWAPSIQTERLIQHQRTPTNNQRQWNTGPWSKEVVIRIEMTIGRISLEIWIF